MLNNLPEAGRENSDMAGMCFTQAWVVAMVSVSEVPIQVVTVLWLFLSAFGHNLRTVCCPD